MWITCPWSHSYWIVRPGKEPLTPDSTKHHTFPGLGQGKIGEYRLDSFRGPQKRWGSHAEGLAEQFGRVLWLCLHQLSSGVSESFCEMGISSVKEGGHPCRFSDPESLSLLLREGEKSRRREWIRLNSRRHFWESSKTWFPQKGSNWDPYLVLFTDLQSRMAVALLLPYKFNAYFSYGQP